MTVTPLALHSPRAVGDTLRAHGWDDGQAAAAAGGIHPIAFHLTGLDQDALLALVRLSGTLGLEVLTGDGWAVLSGSRSRLSAFALRTRQPLFMNRRPDRASHSSLCSWP